MGPEKRLGDRLGGAPPAQASSPPQSCIGRQNRKKNPGWLHDHPHLAGDRGEQSQRKIYTPSPIAIAIYNRKNVTRAAQEKVQEYVAPLWNPFVVPEANSTRSRPGRGDYRSRGQEGRQEDGEAQRFVLSPLTLRKSSAATKTSRQPTRMPPPSRPRSKGPSRPKRSSSKPKSRKTSCPPRAPRSRP